MGVRTKNASQTAFCVLRISRARGIDTSLSPFPYGKIPRRGNNHPCVKPTRLADADVHAALRRNAHKAAQNAPCPRRARQTAPQPDPETEPAGGDDGPTHEIRPRFLPRGLQKAGRGKEQGS